MVAAWSRGLQGVVMFAIALSNVHALDLEEDGASMDEARSSSGKISAAWNSPPIEFSRNSSSAQLRRLVDQDWMIDMSKGVPLSDGWAAFIQLKVGFKVKIDLQKCEVSASLDPGVTPMIEQAGDASGKLQGGFCKNLAAASVCINFQLTRLKDCCKYWRISVSVSTELLAVSKESDEFVVKDFELDDASCSESVAALESKTEDGADFCSAADAGINWPPDLLPVDKAAEAAAQGAKDAAEGAAKGAQAAEQGAQAANTAANKAGDDAKDAATDLAKAARSVCLDWTGGTCGMSSCESHRNAKCDNGRCMCKSDQCAVDGTCVSKDDEDMTSAARGGQLWEHTALVALLVLSFQCL